MRHVSRCPAGYCPSRLFPHCSRCLLKQRMMEVVVTTGLLELCREKFQSNHRSPPTNQYPLFYRLYALPVAQPTVSKHCTKGNRCLKSHPRTNSAVTVQADHGRYTHPDGSNTANVYKYQMALPDIIIIIITDNSNLQLRADQLRTDKNVTYR